MGCVYSTPQRPLLRRSEGSNSPGSGNNSSKIFDVINVDDRGNEINHGQIEVTESDLILHQRNKNSIVWPLRSLRRYGFDAELFSFECGRRCSTGPGIYAFKCVHAEQLFNVLQESLQHCNNPTTPNNHITSPQHGTNQESTINSPGPIGNPSGSSVISGATNGAPPELAARTFVPPVPQPRLPSSPPHSYVNDIRNYINSPFYVNTGVLNGNLIGPPVSSSHVTGSKGRTGSAKSASDINTNYAKLDDLVDYVNIDTAVVTYSAGNTCSNTASGNNEQNDCSSTTTTQCDGLEDDNLTHSTVTINNNLKNGKPPTLPIKPLTLLTTSSLTTCPSSLIATTSLISSTPTTVSPTSTTNHQQLNSSLGLISSASPKLPRKSESSRSESTELADIAEPVNYIVLDLENTTNNNGPTYVTTGPATPVFKTPKEGSFFLSGTTPPSTPTSLKSISSNYPPQSYATIDFDKTLALSTSAANHRKF